MPKLNAIAMVVLALGVIAGTGFLVLHQSPTAPPEQAESRLAQMSAVNRSSEGDMRPPGSEDRYSRP